MSDSQRFKNLWLFILGRDRFCPFPSMAPLQKSTEKNNFKRKFCTDKGKGKRKVRRKKRKKVGENKRKKKVKEKGKSNCGEKGRR